MNRREFLAAGTAAGLALAGPARGQPAQRNRAAVVIGVDSPEGLPALRAAASGARQVAAWLATEGYEVLSFIDDRGKVKASPLFDAVNGLIERGNVEQLVVYFAGHGFSNQYVEYWLLSGAPTNPNEAVSLRESVQLARQSSIPSVTFISDACRSTPDSLKAQGVRGSLIFPTAARSQRPTDVDQFMATLVGDPSFEVPIAESTATYAGLYTEVLLSAFGRPQRDMVRSVGGIDVVPNRRLKGYLELETPRRAQAVSIRLRQNPDAQVTSAEEIYIARVTGTPEGAATSAAVPTLARVAETEFARIGMRGLVPSTPLLLDAGGVRALDERVGFSAAQGQLLEHTSRLTALANSGSDPAPPDIDSGFVVTGTGVTSAWCREAPWKQLAAGTVAVDLAQGRGATVLLRFADGTGTALAALGGFIAAVNVARNGVISVSYLPSKRNYRRGEYEHGQVRLKELQASVATAARFGVFRIEGGKEGSAAASRLAGSIRMMKGVDPTLGLYAAYAYSEAGRQADARSVREIMRGDLNVDLFDAAMLAGALRAGSADRIVPFCPMLAQGWALLRVAGVKLPPVIDKARDHLRPSLWTTFDSAGMELLLAAAQQQKI